MGDASPFCESEAPCIEGSEMTWAVFFLLISLWGLSELWADVLIRPTCSCHDNDCEFSFRLPDQRIGRVEQLEQQSPSSFSYLWYWEVLHHTARSLGHQRERAALLDLAIPEGSQPQWGHEWQSRLRYAAGMEHPGSPNSIPPSKSTLGNINPLAYQTCHYRWGSDEKGLQFAFSLPSGSKEAKISSPPFNKKSIQMENSVPPRQGAPDTRYAEGKQKRQLSDEDGAAGSTKSAKIKTGQTPSSQIRHHISYDHGFSEESESPVTDSLKSTSESGDWDAPRQSQLLFDILSDPSTENSTLMSTHQFSQLQTELVTHALRIVARFMMDSGNGRTHSLDSAGASRQFLCPFYAFDSQKYRDCLIVENLQSIWDVKRHVCSRHSFPLYCAICFQIFTNPTNRDAHVRDLTCSPAEKVELQGVTGNQIDILAKIPRDIPEEKQWVAIFSIVLPQKPIPSCMHTRPGLEASVNHIRSFWDRQGAEIVSTFVMDKIPEMKTNYNLISDEERALAALHRVILVDILGIAVKNFDESVSRIRFLLDGRGGEIVSESVMSGMAEMKLNYELFADEEQTLKPFLRKVLAEILAVAMKNYCESGDRRASPIVNERWGNIPKVAIPEKPSLAQ